MGGPARRACAVARRLGRTFVEQETLDTAAQLSFYTVLSLFPFAMVLVTVVGLLQVRGVLDELRRLVWQLAPSEAAPLVEAALDGAARGASGSVLALGAAAALYTASGAVVALTKALNRARGVRDPRGWLEVHLRAIGITALGAVLVTIVLAVIVLGPDFSRTLVERVGLAAPLDAAWRLARWPLLVAAMVVLLGLLYHACPAVRRPFHLVTPGAALAVPLWVGVTVLFDLYARRLGTFNRTYGALASGVVLLLWIQLSSAVVLLGGQLNAILDRDREARAERR